MEFISKRDSKRILSEKNLSSELLDDYALVSLKGKLSIVSRNVSQINFEDFNIVSIGLSIDRLKEKK